MNFKEPKLNLYDLFVTVICYFIAMALVMYAIKPVEAVFNDNVAVVSYLFLPHGIRIIAAMAYGPVNSFIYLLFAHLVAMVTLQEAYADPSTMVLQATICSAVGPVAIALIGQTFGKASVSLETVSANTWRVMFFAALLASLFSSIFQPIALGTYLSLGEALSTSITYLVGDVLGALAMFAILTLALRTVLRS